MVGPRHQHLFLPLHDVGGLRGAAGVCADLVQHPHGLHGADAAAGGQDSGGEVRHGGAAVRLACRPGAGRGEDTPRAGLAEVPQEGRVGIQLSLSGGTLGQHSLRCDEILCEAVRGRAGRHAGDMRRLLPPAGRGGPGGQPAGAGTSGCADGSGHRAGGAEQLSLGPVIRLDHTALRPAGRASTEADGAAGPHGVRALPPAHQSRARAVAELAGGRRHSNTGRQRGDSLYFPRELLLHGGRQGLELAGLPLLGLAAGEFHRGQGVQGVVVGR